jgi:hypothetical protein
MSGIENQINQEASSHELLTLQEAAEILQVSPRWLRNHWQDWGGIKIGTLKFFKEVILLCLEAIKQNAIRKIERHDVCHEVHNNANRRSKSSSFSSRLLKCRYRHKLTQCGVITANGTPCKLTAIHGERCATHGGPNIYSIT